jgi:hypothetical protein
MATTRLAHLFYGTVIQPHSLHELNIALCTLLGVYPSGRIAFVIQQATTEQFQKIKADYIIDNVGYVFSYYYLLI